MLRRALKEGASLKAAAELFGYSEANLETSMAEHMPTDRGYDEPEKTSDDMFFIEQELAKLGFVGVESLRSVTESSRSAVLAPGVAAG
jgi:hypothetical protein